MIILSADYQIDANESGRANATAVIKNHAGIHCRPTAVIVKEARKFDDTIVVRTTDDATADPKSAIELLSLGLDKGSEVEILVEGDTASACCAKMVELLETQYDFPPRAKGETIEIDDLMA